tara:strand:+ start:1033 stop:1314 length:282 start_codon:yes stop_codon:yes gene_type:complete
MNAEKMYEMITPNKKFGMITYQALDDLIEYIEFQPKVKNHEFITILLHHFGRLVIKDCAEYIHKYNYECIREDVPYGVTSEDILNHFQINGKR